MPGHRFLFYLRCSVGLFLFFFFHIFSLFTFQHFYNYTVLENQNSCNRPLIPGPKRNDTRDFHNAAVSSQARDRLRSMYFEQILNNCTLRNKVIQELHYLLQFKVIKYMIKKIMTALLKKTWYYSDLSLHSRILKGIIAVEWCRKSGFHNAVPETTSGNRKHGDRLCMKIQQYCSLWFRIRKKFFFKDSCFFRSALQCRVLRKTGFDARLNFGTIKDTSSFDTDWHTTGHCWVSFGTETLPTEYTFVFQFPLENTV